MRFIISKSKLMNALNIVSKAVTNKTPIAVLTGIKFELKEDGLTLVGSDTDLSISTFISTEENNEKVICDLLRSYLVVYHRYGDTPYIYTGYHTGPLQFCRRG